MIQTFLDDILFLVFTDSILLFPFMNGYSDGRSTKILNNIRVITFGREKTSHGVKLDTFETKSVGVKNSRIFVLFKQFVELRHSFFKNVVLLEIYVRIDFDVVLTY